MQNARSYLGQHWLGLWLVRLRQGQFEKSCESNHKEVLTVGPKRYLFRRIHRVESDDSLDTIKNGILDKGGGGPKAPNLC